MLDTIRQKLLQNFPDADIQFQEGLFDGRHLQMTIVSSRFQGLTLLGQHRLVHDVLKEFLEKDLIHGVQIKTQVK